MRIGEVAEHTGVSIQALRYYERRGLLAEPQRRTSGYRQYTREAVQQVRFIKRAQDIGFTLREIADLLTLWGDSAKSCGEIEKRATRALARIDGKLRELERMRVALAQYVAACRDRRSLEKCPLMTVLGREEDVSA
jgi:MerR family copper efflux transcriptional regulator